PQPASACDVVGFLDNRGCPFPQPSPLLPTCSLLNPSVSATADGNRNSYTYDLGCDQGIAIIHVAGAYSFDSGAVNESLATDANGISLNWTCPHDPWIAPSQPVCSSGKVVSSNSTGQFEITSFDIIGRTQPISTQFLDDDSRQ